MAEGTPGNAVIRALESAPMGQLNLRGDPADAAFLAAARSALGLELPLEPNTVAAGAERRIYWLGPDEWLVVTPAYPAAALAGALRSALGALHSSVTDVSGSQAIVVLQGAAVRDVLAQECPLDLHPRVFRPGQCAQTRLAKTAIILRPLDEHAIEVIVRRSFAGYFWRWLAEAARDYGLDAVRSSHHGSTLTTTEKS